MAAISLNRARLGRRETPVLRRTGKVRELSSWGLLGLRQPPRQYAAGSSPLFAAGMGGRGGPCREATPLWGAQGDDLHHHTEAGWEMIHPVQQARSLRCRWVTCDGAFGRNTDLLD